MSLKRTPLYAAHQKLGGKLIEFGGWEMPVQYTSIVDEHLCVRSKAGVFDICHMGEVRVTGAGAAGWLNSVLGNDIRKLAVGQGQYTHLCNERGGTVDDLYAYRLAETEYLLIINASRIEPDVAWFRSKFPPAGSVDLTFVDQPGDLPLGPPNDGPGQVQRCPGQGVTGNDEPVADVNLFLEPF